MATKNTKNIYSSNHVHSAYTILIHHTIYYCDVIHQNSLYISQFYHLIFHIIRVFVPPFHCFQFYFSYSYWWYFHYFFWLNLLLYYIIVLPIASFNATCCIFISKLNLNFAFCKMPSKVDPVCCILFLCFHVVIALDVIKPWYIC